MGIGHRELIRSIVTVNKRDEVEVDWDGWNFKNITVFLLRKKG